MPEPFAMDAGVQYAFAPSPELEHFPIILVHILS